MAELIELLIPKAKAQQSNIIAQPSFGTITSGGTDETAASVLLTSNATAAAVGDEFTVSVAIDTAGTEIAEYRVVIDFDPEVLSVVDSDPTTAGTQIEFTDALFTIEDPANDNTVSSVGRIRLNAEAPTGQSLAVNKNVATVTFQAQSVGTGNIAVVDGVVGSQLIRSGGTAIAFTNNEIGVNVSTVAANPGTGQNNGQNNGGQNGNPSNPGGTPVSNPVGNGGTPLPNTSIVFGLESYLLLLAGIVSILISVLLKQPKNPDN